MTAPRIETAEYAQRRRALRESLDGSIGLIMAGAADADLDASYRPHPHFEYLTGVVDEPGAVLLLDPSHPVESRRDTLFLQPSNPESEQWDGLRLTIGKTLRDRTGFETIHRTTMLPRVLTAAATRARSLACLHPLARYDQPVSPDLAIFKRIAERVPGVEILDRSEVPAQLRSVKSAAEIAVIQAAVDVTAEAFRTVMSTTAPGLGEADLESALHHAYRTGGAAGAAFGTIVGAGINSTVLHYRANDKPIGTGDMICIDSGASVGGYGADITRTIPADGTFSPRQREIYEIVLEAEQAAIDAVKPGVRIAELDKLARAIITKAGYGDAFIHGIGHHLGLETHDHAPADAALAPGCVVTIEPGIYLPDERLGVRIEDDVVVTDDGSRTLSAAIPKTVADVEAAMAG